jgi:hypothetical protein
MKARTLLLSLVLAATTTVGFAAPASAGPCEPGDPNCNIGCEIINRVFKDSCQT